MDTEDAVAAAINLQRDAESPDYVSVCDFIATDVVGDAQSGVGAGGVSLSGGSGSVSGTSCTSGGAVYVRYGVVAPSSGPG